MNKLAAYLILFVVCALSALAYPGITTTFSNGMSSADLQYINGTSTDYIRYVNLAIGSAVLTGTFDITGYNYSIPESSSVSTQITGITLSVSSSSSIAHGLKIRVGNVDMKLISATRSGGTNIPTTCYLRATYNGANIATASFGGGLTCTFATPQTLTANTDYYILADKAGSNFDVYYNIIAGGHYPIPKTGFNYTAGARASTGDDTTLAAVFTGLTVNVTTPGALGSYPTNVTILLNDIIVYNYGSSNNSILNGTKSVNITANFTNPISTYPSKLTFLSNTTGGLIINNLFFEDSSRNFTFNFYDEQDGTIFDLNATNSSVLTIKCPESQYEYAVNDGTFYVGVDCAQYDLIKFSITQNGEAYWRSLVLPPGAGTTPTLDYYLVNLNNKSVVQIIVTLDDLTGYKWSGSTVKLSKPVNTTANAVIVEQIFDVDNKVYLYLMQDEQYTITITNNYGEVWSGIFIADSATTKTITLPGTGFGGDNYWERDIKINYTFSASQNYFSAKLLDLGNNTEYASLTLIDTSNESVVLYFGEYTGSFITGVSFVVSDANIHGNNSYTSTLVLHHSILGVMEQQKVWGDYTGGISPGHWGTDWHKITKYFTFLILIIIILGFGAKDSHIGLAICLILMVVFKKMGWLDWVTGITLGVIALIIGSNWWRKEEVSAG